MGEPWHGQVGLVFQVFFHAFFLLVVSLPIHVSLVAKLIGFEDEGQLISLPIALVHPLHVRITRLGQDVFHQLVGVSVSLWTSGRFHRTRSADVQDALAFRTSYSMEFLFVVSF